MSLSAPEDAFLDVNDAHLRVYGNVHADGLKLGQLEIVTTTSTGSTIQFLHQHTAFTTTSNIEVGTTNHDLFVDTNASKVGVLTNTPTTALDVNGTVKATAFDGDGALLTGIPSSAINGTLSQWTTVTGPKIHYSDGNVGIGIADPLHTLDVVGDINFTGTLREDGNPFVSTPWTIESGPTALSYTLGNVGVGGTTPSAKLEVTGNAHVSTDLSVGEKIGVGVDSPDANLHVVGNCHVSTNMELGGTLVMGTVTVEAQHALSAITATGNTTPHTIEFQNAETSLVTTGNVQVGGELNVTGQVTRAYNPGEVIEELNSICDGSTVTVQSGSYTMANITAYLVGTLTHQVITGSTINYTPPPGTKRVYYRFWFKWDAYRNSARSHFQFQIDDVVVTPSKNSIGSASSSDHQAAFPVSVEYTIDCNTASNDASNGKFTSWTNPKELECTFRDYSGSEKCLVHVNEWTDGTGTDSIQKPHLTIRAIA